MTVTDVKIEGTFLLDGLMEGRLFGAEDEDFIRQWVQTLGRKGIGFHLTVSGGRFSLLPDRRPVALAGAEQVLTDALRRLMEPFSNEERATFMSTLRSVEYRPGEEVQTMYALHSSGRVSVQQKAVPAETTPPARPLSMQEKIKFGVGLLVALLVLFAVSAFFIPYRDIAAETVNRLRPYDMERLEIQLGAFDSFFTVGTVERDRKENRLLLVCVPAADYPRTAEALTRRWEESASLADRLATEAVARGQIRCELYDREGRWLGQLFCRVQWDEAGENVFVLQVPFSREIYRIVMGV